MRKVFLADGDALVAKPAFLLALLEKLRAAFPALQRVSCYASPQALQVRSVEDACAAMTAALDFMQSREVSGSVEDLVAFTELGRRNDAVVLAMTRRFDADQLFALDGAASAAAWMRAHLRMTPARPGRRSAPRGGSTRSRRCARRSRPARSARPTSRS